MIEDVQFSSILGLYHGKSAKVAGNPRNFKKSPGNYSIMEGIEWYELKLSMVLSQTRISLSPPPPHRRFCKKSEKNANSSIGVNILGWGGRRVGL